MIVYQIAQVTVKIIQSVPIVNFYWFTWDQENELKTPLGRPV